MADESAEDVETKDESVSPDSELSDAIDSDRHLLELRKLQEPARLSDLIFTLLSPKTLPHLLLLIMATLAAHIVSSIDGGLAIGLAAFIGFTIGYALTAILQRFPIIAKWSRFPEAEEASTGVGDMLSKAVFGTIACWLVPLLLSIPVTLAILYLLYGPLENHVNSIAIAMGGMFLLWSAGQAYSFSSSTRLTLDSWLPESKRTDEKKARTKTSATAHVTIVMVAAGVLFWIIILGMREDGVGFGEIIAALGYLVVVGAVQALVLWRTKETRAKVGKIRGASTRAYLWGLILQLLVAYHLLATWRRFSTGGFSISVVIEELILMIITIIGAIWAISSTGVRKESVLFTRDNALFWGLSFGFGYAATISMLATTISTTGSQSSLSAAIGLGHFVTAATLVWLHIRRLESFADTASGEQDLSEDEEDADDEDQDEERSEVDESDSDSDDWDEAGWKDPDDVIDDSTSSIQGADVDWQNDGEDDEDDLDAGVEEDDLDGEAEDEDADDDEIELVDLGDD